MQYDKEQVWELLCDHAGEVFHTVKGLDFTYEIRGNEIFFTRKEKSVTKASVELAVNRMQELGGVVKGPKKLKVFGASYLYPVFLQLGLLQRTS